MKSKKVFKINIVNSFLITVLNYQDVGEQHPTPAPARLEAEGALYLEASLSGFNKPLKQDDLTEKVLREGSTQISWPFTCLAQGKVTPASCRQTLPGF